MEKGSEMNKSQKIIIAITLIIMAFILIYPPVEEKGPRNVILSKRRSFLFSFPESKEKFWHFQLITRKLISELLVIACMGGALIILFGLKK